MSDVPPTDHTRLKRLPARGSYERGTIERIIDAAPICHVALISGERPVVIPMLHARVDRTLYLHGSRGSRLLRSLMDGADACAAFTLLDGLVLARSALHHSMNYRSVVLFGRGRAVEDEDEKHAALRALVEQVVPGRYDGTRQTSETELKATAVAALPIDEASAKVRTGPPVDDAADMELDHWAGVIPMQLVAGAPQPAPDLRAGIPVPEHVSRYVGGRAGAPVTDGAPGSA
ncbi:MAG: pyridoxamine 5'-phosphate oxidase family protein [Planctomycetota bacterium]